MNQHQFNTVAVTLLSHGNNSKATCNGDNNGAQFVPGKSGICMEAGEARLQANKNTLIKGRVGTGGVSAALAFKAWWQPSFWFALSGGFDFRLRQPKFGLTFGSENYGNIRYAVSLAGPLS